MQFLFLFLAETQRIAERTVLAFLIVLVVLAFFLGWFFGRKGHLNQCSCTFRPSPLSEQADVVNLERTVIPDENPEAEDPVYPFANFSPELDDNHLTIPLMETNVHSTRPLEDKC